MSALAQVVDDIRRGKVRRGLKDRALHVAVNDVAKAATDAPLVDATFIYDTYRRKKGIAIYEDHPSILPPWEVAWIGYRNEHGNANATMVVADDWEPSMAWESEHGNSLDGAAHRLSLWFFGGGRSQGKPSPTFGPIALTRVAVHESGEPLDILWVDLLQDGKPEQWDWSRWTVLGVYGFLNSRNIEVIPDNGMRRPDRRREQRLGIRSHVLTVKPTGSRRAATGAAGGDPVLLPMSSVRGHYAHYGACCRHHEPGGLLFGKLTGRVWVPQYARGDDEVGTVEQTFVIADD